MATHGTSNDSTNWPLPTHIQSPTVPVHSASPPPSYQSRESSRADVIQSLSQIPKRRPLSSTANLPNFPNRPPNQPLSPVQGNVASEKRAPMERKASFETGDDAYLGKPGNSESGNWNNRSKAASQPTSPLTAQAPTTQSIPLRQRQTVEGPARISQPTSPLTAQTPNTQSIPVTQRQTVGGPALRSQPTSPMSAQAPMTQSIPIRQRQTVQGPALIQQPQSAVMSMANDSAPSSRHVSGESRASTTISEELTPQPLQYHHQMFDVGKRRFSAESNGSRTHVRRTSREMPQGPPSQGRLTPANRSLLGANLARPTSAYSSGSEGPNRTLSPGLSAQARTPSPSRHSPDNRPMSYVDLLNVPYPQPPPASSNLDSANAQLRSSVGQNASLLSTKKTLEMYRTNAKKTNDPTIQYEFAIFMVNTAQEMSAAEGIDIHSKPRSQNHAESNDASHTHPAELLREARQILQKLSDRSYPFAQYYLADGYASGLFSKGNPDNDRAFPLFISASKHGHAEAGYRAALCYEFGWGSRKDFAKAVQFYRQSASKNHPGAAARLGRACFVGDLGLGERHREGFKWLKRAAESADFQYNTAPYELGLLHESGFGDDIFQDEGYAAQLFTQSADLGHIEANYRLGDAYEHGKLHCPRDPALSVHFYTGAAQRGHPLAMMALCAWYMVGAEPVLDKNEAEACEWARKAAETGTSTISAACRSLYRY